MSTKLIRADSAAQMHAVLQVVNLYSGLISPKCLAQSQDKRYYIVTDEDDPVGVTGYRPLNKWVAEQVNTVILPEYRGMGYGEKASNLMTEKLFDSGFGKVFCTVRTDNQKMLNLKHKQGFNKEGLLKNHFGAGRNIYLLAKEKGE